MIPVMCINVQRHKGEPLFQVSVEDVGNPVDLHSYNCLFSEKCRTFAEFEELKENARMFIDNIIRVEL